MRETVEVTCKRFACRHIHPAGRRCGSPALRGEDFCYFHHTTRPPARADRFISPDADFDLPSFEDRASLQAAIAKVARRVALNQLDPRRARILLHSLRVASSNLARETSESRPDRASTRHDQPAADIIEEVFDHPDLGLIAPVLDFDAPQNRAKTINERLLEFLQQGQQPPAKPPAPTAPASDPELPSPPNLPNLHAASDQEALCSHPARKKLHRPRPGRHTESENPRRFRQPSPPATMALRLLPIPVIHLRRNHAFVVPSFQGCPGRDLPSRHRRRPAHLAGPRHPSRRHTGLPLSPPHP